MDLVQGEIDGANTALESAELRDLIVRDPQAGRALEEFAALARGLGGLADVPPPAELRRAVMHEITTRSLPSRRSEGGILARLWPGRGPALRYAWVGVMVVGVGVVAAYWKTLNRINVDGRSVSGTLAPATAVDRTDAWTIDAEGVSGSLRRVDDPGGFGIAFDIAGSGPLSVVVAFDPGAARFAGVAGGAPEISDATGAASGRVRIAATPGSPFTARFERREGAGAVLGVRLERAEIVLQEWTIEFPGR